MDNVITLNSNSSTTRLLTKEKPILEQKPEYKLESKLFLLSNAERKGEGGLRTKGYFKKSYNDKPLISIVTVVYNGEKHLEQTIKSVLDQSYDNVEYIIVDGGSTDGTVEIIQKYEDKIDYWVSEPDNGIADAFNKGIKVATGEWIGIVNADDWYEPEVLKIIATLCKYDFAFGCIKYWENDIYRIDRARPEIIYDDMRINHPTLFVRSYMYKKVGLFDCSYKYAMDYELTLRLFRLSNNYKNIDSVMTNMRTEGVSQKFWVQSKLEAKNIKIKQGVSTFKATKYFTSILFRRYTFFALNKYNLNYVHTVYKYLFGKQ